MKPEGKYKPPKNVKWTIKLHRHLFKPPYPVRIACPACRHWWMSVNAGSIEVENGHGMNYNEVLPNNVWMRIQHQCGVWVTFYWSE